MRRKTALATLTLVLCAGAMLRAGYLAERAEAPDWHAPLFDAQYHDYWARGIALGQWRPPVGEMDPRIRSTPYFRPPGYPLFLAAVYGAAGTHPLAPRLAQMGLGLAACAMLYFVAARAFGRATGLVGAALAAFHWPLVYFEGELLAASLAAFLVVALHACLAAWLGGPRRLAWLGAAGAALGLLCLTRPNALLCAPAVALWVAALAWRRAGAMQAFAAIGVLTAATCLTIAPATLRNRLRSGEWALISTNGGVNLYLGNNPSADGISPGFPDMARAMGILGWGCFDYPAIVRAVERAEGRSMAHGEVSKWFARRAFRHIRDRPGHTAKLIARKALLMWGPLSVTNNKVAEVERRHSIALRVAAVDFPAIFALALVSAGLFALRAGKAINPAPDRRALVALILSFILTWFVSLLPFFAAGRYRVPYTPLLIALCAPAPVIVARLWRSGRRGRALAAAACGALAWAALGIPAPGYTPDPARWRLHRGWAWRLAGRSEQAADELRRSLALRPDASAHAQLGLILLEQGRLAEAAEQYRAALKMQPYYDAALAGLLTALARTGDAERARAYVEAHLRRYPDHEAARAMQRQLTPHPSDGAE